ncbi:hypothetical protein LCGC14_2464350, partial [marine sediment metagenome]
EILEIKPMFLPSFKVTPDHKIKIKERINGKLQESKWISSNKLDKNHYL